MTHLFEPLTLRGVTLKNRIAMAPMCMYSAGADGVVADWHRVHYPTRAVGGVGLILLEATAVEPRGRIRERDLGIWGDRHVEPLARLVDLCHERGARVGIQLAHAGRKAWTDGKGFGPEPPVAPSPIPFAEGWNTPHPLAGEEVDTVVAAFQAGARRAQEAGFDVVEIHGAHGYLVNQFLSPLVNHREDEYGGSAANRRRFLHRAVDAARCEWPEDRPLLVRLSCREYAPGGNDLEDIVEVAKTLRERGVDLVDCSSGAVVEFPPPSHPGYQIPFAERIRREAAIPTGAVGLITTAEMAEEVVCNGRADLVILGRALLRDPYWPLNAARELGVEVEWPVQYRRARR